MPEGEKQYYDHGLAYRDGIFAITDWVHDHERNHSFEMIKKSKQCLINIPTFDMIDTIISIGNPTGAKIDKFKEFQLTAQQAGKVKAPLIKECFANYECKVVNNQLLDKYNFFVLEVVRAHVATSPKYPKTVHYRGNGKFMVSGKTLDYSRQFKPEMPG